MENYESVLKYWFGDRKPGEPVSEERMSFWFERNDSADREAREKFGTLLEQARDGQLPEWETDSRGCLALILLLDQVSRMAYRDQAEAFSHDRQALRLCLRGIDRGLDRNLNVVERAFFYLPLLHSEDRQVQEKSLHYFTALAQEAPEETWDFIDRALDHAIRHSEVIERFGRFPQRNDILGRKSTEEEREYLSEPGIGL